MSYLFFLFFSFLVLIKSQVNKLTFSLVDNFDNECNNPDATNEIDGSNGISTISLYYCLYIYQLPPGTYYSVLSNSISNSNTNKSESPSYTYSEPTDVRLYGSLPLNYIAFGMVGDVTFTLNFEDSNDNIIVADSFTIVDLPSNLGNIDSITISVKPSNSNSNIPVIIYGDGDTVILSTIDDIGVFCSSYSNMFVGNYVELYWEGLESGYQRSGIVTEITELTENREYQLCEDLSFNVFANDENIKITSYIYDGTYNEINTMSIIINYSIEVNDNEDKNHKHNNNNGNCVEKEGKNKKACYDQINKNDCESLNKCEWIN